MVKCVLKFYTCRKKKKRKKRKRPSSSASALKNAIKSEKIKSSKPTSSYIKPERKSKIKSIEKTHRLETVEKAKPVPQRDTKMMNDLQLHFSFDELSGKVDKNYTDLPKTQCICIPPFINSK